jgi:hypothetical protein
MRSIGGAVSGVSGVPLGSDQITRPILFRLASPMFILLVLGMSVFAGPGRPNMPVRPLY